ncbi:hypothetical protein OG592_43860 (plasmid) [Streptomyces avidinii]|uniref:hypothetical protein n=1 Tax=Streptomyces avidinii TaxID=1895 RepID=UPI002F917481|nr:hypothetical protein OG592_43860 [Streptomyces avidinii]
MTRKSDETRPGKSETAKTAKRERRKPMLEEIPFVREVPVLASATMVVLRYVGAWLRGGDEESGGFGVRLIALGLTGYLALYFAEKHPGLWYAYGGAGFLLATTVAVRTGLSAGRTVKELESAPAPAEEEQPGTDTANDHEMAGEEGLETEPPTVSPAQADAAFDLFVEYNVAYAVRTDPKGDRKGVHTDTLLNILHKNGMLTDWTEPMLRKRCKSVGIPVRKQMGIKGRNYFGVHVEDLEQALGRAVRVPPQLVPDLTPDGPAAPPAEPPAPAPEVALIQPPA